MLPLLPNQKIMNILVIGSGGREHAISYSLKQSPHCETLFIAPGNAGTAQIGQNTSLDTQSPTEVISFVQHNQIELVVIGPEAPLANGLADHLRQANIPTVGPGQTGAVLESSKEWSKRFMARHQIPTAAYQSFDASQIEEAVNYVRNHSLPVVVKASGLAAGKGVLICASHDEAETGVREMLSGDAFGSSGHTIVVEEFLTGLEVSVFVLTDGKNHIVLPEAKDYKRIGEGDTGLNTGGMGAVSPVPFADQIFMEKVRDRIIQPTLEGLSQENIPYQGFIFLGLIEVKGEPYVIEYNVRMGDPETEVVFPRIASDTVELLAACANGTLDQVELQTKPEACTTVMLVSGGYPGSYPKGIAITGTSEVKDATVFHAGTKTEGDQLLTNGGRVIAVTALGKDIPEALEKSLSGAATIQFEGRYFRTDIGKDLI